MVITDVPFDARLSRAKYGRYSLIRRPGSTAGRLTEPEVNDEDASTRESLEYAAFLKEQERKVGQDGFLDSRKFTHTFSVSEKLKKLGEQGGERVGTPRPRSLGDQPIRPNNAVNVLLHAEEEKKAYDKRIRVIEDHMWQHKQEERELKRVEGDVIKKRYAVRHTLRDFENKVRKKRLEVDQQFNKGMERFTKLEQSYQHQKVDSIKERGELNVEALHEMLEGGRKFELQKTDLARKYRVTMNELELKQIQHHRLVSEYEQKLKHKEEEQFKLKQQLAELAITLNMEAQKAREFKVKTSDERRKEISQRIQQDLNTQSSLANKLGKSDSNVKTAITQNRRLSADLTLTRANLGLKSREEVRQLQDTRNELNDNGLMQRKLNEAAYQSELDLKIKQNEKKLQMHEVRKQHQLQHALTARKEMSESQERLFSEKFQKRYHDMAKREHEDHMRHFQRMVAKGEEEENRLFAQVREAEYARQKQEQKVNHLQQRLQQTRNNHAQEAKNKLIEMSNAEKELEHKFSRERALLDKLHSEREENYYSLQKHREMLKIDQHNLEENQREHLRLQRISQRTGAPSDSAS